MSIGQTIRVFLSSTFRDMHAERDVVGRVVFPELRSRCARRGVEFVGVDLRWGVTEEEAKRQGALKVCLEEIERCRPFFVGLLGERFGWVPPPEEVPEELFREAGAAAEPEIARWYQLDATSTPAVYRLRRELELPDVAAESLVGFWEAHGLPLAGESITAREILQGVLDPGFPASHALFYLRREGLEADLPPDLAPVFVEEDPRRRAKLAALKERLRLRRGEIVVRDYDVGYAGLRLDPVFVPEELAEREREVLADGVIGPQEWPRLGDELRRAVARHGTVALTGVTALGERIIEDLWAAIEADLEQPAARLDEDERERAEHERFVVERTRLFVGQEAAIERVLDYLGVGDRDDGPLDFDSGSSSSPRLPLVVTGESGCGKSALLAECVRRQRARSPETLVLPHFIGSSPGSTALPSTLKSLCEALRRAGGLAEEVPEDPDKLRSRLGLFFERVTAVRPVVLVLDALDQLDPADRSHELDWLPTALSEGARVVVSALRGDCLEWLRARVPSANVVELPRLSDGDRRRIVESYLEVRRKRLDAGQLDRLLDRELRPDSDLPLYLRVALEELCLFGDYAALDERIDRLPPTLPRLFEQVLARLDQDHGRLTEAVCGWLAVARAGLAEAEVLDLLGDVPRARWTRLYRQLEVYLHPPDEEGRTARLDFNHEQLRLAALRRYCDMSRLEEEATPRFTAAHRRLADYFHALAADPGAPRGWRRDRRRALAELPYHQILSRDWEGAERTLTDLGFIEAKAGAGDSAGLLRDFELALAEWPGSEVRERRNHLRRFLGTLAALQTSAPNPDLPPHHERVHVARPPRSVALTAEPPPPPDTPLERLRAFSAFAANHAERLGAGREPVPQLAWNWAEIGPVAAAAGRALADLERGAWLRRLDRPTANPACVWSVPGTSRPYLYGSALSLSADGRRALSIVEEKTVRLWDLATGEGRDLHKFEVGVLAVDLSLDGRWAAWCGRDRVPKEDSPTENLIHVLDLSTSSSQVVDVGIPPEDFRIAPDGLRIAGSTLADQIFDWEPGLERPRYYGGGSRMMALAAGGLLVLGRDDGTLELFDLERGRTRPLSGGHQGSLRAVTVTPDGRWAATAGADDKLLLWDLVTGEARATPGSWPCGSLGITADGRHAVVSSGGLAVVDLESGQHRRLALEGGAVRVTPDGQRALSACVDPSAESGTIRLWDLEGRVGDLDEPAPGGSVWAVALAADGRHAHASHEGTVWRWSDGRWAEGSSFSTRAIAPLPGGNALLGGAGGLQLLEGGGESLRDGERGVLAVALTPTGSHALAGGESRVLSIWDLETRRCRKLTGHEGWIVAVASTPDGRFGVSAGRDGTLRVWDLEDGRGRALRGHTGFVAALAIAHDGRTAVSGGEDGSVRLWDLATGRCRTLSGHEGRVNALAVAPDGRRLVSGGRDGALKIWDLEEDGEHTLGAHEGEVSAVRLDTEGRRALSAGLDGWIHLWDLDRGLRLASHSVPDDRIRHLDVRWPRLILGTEGRGAAILQVEGSDAGGTLLATPTRMWRFRSADGRGRWDDPLTVACPGCGARSPVADRSPATLPCPSCQRELRLSPVVCDLRGGAILTEAAEEPEPVWREVGLRSAAASGVSAPWRPTRLRGRRVSRQVRWPRAAGARVEAPPSPQRPGEELRWVDLPYRGPSGRPWREVRQRREKSAGR